MNFPMLALLKSVPANPSILPEMSAIFALRLSRECHPERSIIDREAAMMRSRRIPRTPAQSRASQGIPTEFSLKKPQTILLQPTNFRLTLSPIRAAILPPR